jgi:ParB/RepB/Spo0J family partition protein
MKKRKMKTKPTKTEKPSPVAGTPAPPRKPIELARDYIPAFNLSLIAFDKDNARDDAADAFKDAEEDTAAFIESIRQKGVQQPVWIRAAKGLPGGKTHVLFAGERRVRGALAAGRLTVPAFDYGTLHDDVAAELADVENCQRENLTVGQRIRAYAKMVTKHGWSYWDEKNPDKSLGHRLNLGGKSTSFQWARLARLPVLALQAIDSGELTASVAAKLAGIFDPKSQKDATERAIRARWSDKDAADFIARDFTSQLKGVSFDTKDATLLPAAGSCEGCPFRSGNQADFIGGRGDICGKPSCLREKEAAQFHRDSKTHPGIVWTPKQATAAGLTSDSYTTLSSEWMDLKTSGWIYYFNFDCKGKPLKSYIADVVGADEIILALANNGSGIRYEILPKSRVKSILAQKGLLKTEPQNDGDKERKAAKAKACAIIDAVVSEVVEFAEEAAADTTSIANMMSTHPLFIATVHHIATDLHDEGARRIAKRRNLEPAALKLANKNASHRDMVPAYAKTCTPVQRVGLLAEMLCDTAPGWDGELSHTNWDDSAVAVMKWLQLDIVGVLSEARFKFTSALAGKKGAKK